VATAPKAATPVTPESLINEQRPQSKESKDHEKAKKDDKKVKTSNSFVMNLFRGQFYPNEVFPYPNVLNEEQKDNVKMLLDPISKFFEEKNDPDKNDKAEKVFLQ
jgi:very long chain acyl-CoA dehydrogenase